ncbi:MAG: hypothetical protein ABSH16_13385 [Sedimentisphaerales bacterium]
MDWTIEYNEKEKILFVKTSGAGTWDENRKLCKEIFAAARKNRTHRFLVQHSGGIKLSIVEIDRIPDLLEKMDVCAEDRAALVYDPASPGSTMLTFLKNVLYLRSYHLQLFTDIDKAVAWLKSELT